MGILEKIQEIEHEIARTQKNKGTHHFNISILTRAKGEGFFIGIRESGVTVLEELYCACNMGITCAVLRGVCESPCVLCSANLCYLLCSCSPHLLAYTRTCLHTRARTHTYTATEYHLGLLKAKLARYRSQLLEGPKTAGAKVGMDSTCVRVCVFV